MIKRLTSLVAFTLGLTGCTLPAATGRLLDAAAAGLDQAVANQKAAHAAIAKGLDAQQGALRDAVEADLRSLAEDDRVPLADAIELLEAHYRQTEALSLARRRHESDSRVAADNLEATRQLVELARRLVLVSTSLRANVQSTVELLKTRLQTTAGKE